MAPICAVFPSFRPPAPLLLGLLSCLALGLGCKSDGPKPVAGQGPVPNASAAGEPRAPAPVDAVPAGHEGAAAVATGGTASADGVDTDVGPASGPAGEDAGEATGAPADAPAADAPKVTDPKPALAEAKNHRVKDDAAMAALAQAEAAGATVRELAQAAQARADKLFAAPDRAKTFYEWAAAKDPKFPDPLFSLAKQAANQGELDEAKQLLVQVKARGGKKLLGQIDFDPMWEVLKDDPEVRKLIDGR